MVNSRRPTKGQNYCSPGPGCQLPVENLCSPARGPGCQLPVENLCSPVRGPGCQLPVENLGSPVRGPGCQLPVENLRGPNNGPGSQPVSTMRHFKTNLIPSLSLSNRIERENIKDKKK